jgi:hypothetical protein
MLLVLFVFLVLLLVAYAAWRLLPDPFDWIVAGIVVLVALYYLITNVDTFEDADAAGYIVGPFLPFVAMAARPNPLSGRAAADELAGSGRKSWMPTRKFWAMLTAGLASIAASWIVTGAFDDVERGMAATLLVAAVGAYWKSNEDTPGGVPLK